MEHSLPQDDLHCAPRGHVLDLDLVPVYRQGQMLCTDMLTTLLADVTFAVHSMDLYSAK